MAQEQWTAVDRYICDLVIPADKALDGAMAAANAAGLPAISVAPSQGKLLHLLARIHGANKVLEIGTLAGYSTIWLARALPKEGRVITLEFEPKHAEVARANLLNAGLSERVEVKVGAAIETLPTLVGEGPFDLIFIDADKQNTAEYFQWALKLSRVGSVIIVDNVIRNGEIINAASEDPGVVGVRRFNELLKKEKRVSATQIQTVGSKGYDGLCIALVIANPKD